LPDIIEEYDDFGMCDAAAVECALDLGWNMKEYIDRDIIDTLYSYFIYDEEETVSLQKCIVAEALDYIEAHVGAA